MTRHTHKLRYVALSADKKYKVYACQLDCTSYFNRDIVVGMVIQCWSCLKEFEFERRNLRQVKPRCRACNPGARKGATPADIKKAKASDDLLKRLGIE